MDLFYWVRWEYLRFFNTSVVFANDVNEVPVIQLEVCNNEELVNVKKMIDEHNMKTRELWTKAALRESSVENRFLIVPQDGSPSLLSVGSRKAYVEIFSWLGGYKYEYVASYDVSGKRIVNFKSLAVRPNFSNVTTRLEGYDYKFLDQQRVIAFNTDVSVSVKNSSSGNIEYFTLHDYIECNYEYKGESYDE